jgi:Bifunctional DNA primase/polymerase, N-terminal
MNTVLDTALSYAARDWPVFPRRGKGGPLVKWGSEATTDEKQIRDWWRRWPDAQIGIVTGAQLDVLDIDCKGDGPTGFDTLADLGFPLWFTTPTVHTQSGGCHAYFAAPAVPIRNTAGTQGRGIGVQLDWRGVGGCVVAPSPGSRYRWDPILGPDTPLAEVPAALLPRQPRASALGGPAPVSPDGLTRYAAAALDKACRLILAARRGEQETTLNNECFSIGTLAGAGGIPSQFARSTLQWAASQLPDLDPSRPWRPGEAASKAVISFDAGVRQPRRSVNG